MLLTLSAGEEAALSAAVAGAAAAVACTLSAQGNEAPLAFGIIAACLWMKN